ncbi:hypothetical protein TNCV_4691651 [Trichonephila clavipes]|nr:hypothetical protein TNCV_4691651 [Trichonephila clavipes]
MVVNSHLSISVMVSSAVQGQVPHPLIVPEFLRPTSCGMTSARFCEGDTRNRGVMGKCVQMWTRNYGALGQTARETRGKKEKEQRKKDKRVRERERTEGGGKTEKRERRRKETERESRRESEARLEWRKRAESGNWSEKDDERWWR